MTGPEAEVRMESGRRGSPGIRICNALDLERGSVKYIRAALLYSGTRISIVLAGLEARYRRKLLRTKAIPKRGSTSLWNVFRASASRAVYKRFDV